MNTWNRFQGVIALMLVFSAIVMPVGVSGQESDDRPESRYYYTGILGDGIGIQMELVMDSSGVTGSYMYDKIGSPLSLSGSIDKETSIITIVEQDEKGNRTGTFVGKLESEGTNYAKTIEGKWMKAGGGDKIPFKLNKIAYYITSETKAGGKYEMSYMYPDFISGLKPYQEISQELEKNALAEQAKFMKEAEEFFKSEESEPRAEWQERYNYAIEYYSPEVVSLSGEIYVYGGGAHGNTDYMSSNYWIKDGKPYLLKLSDLFLQDSDYLKALSDYCINDLRKQEAGWVVDGQLKELSSDDMSAFAISPMGISIAFAPYAVGSYAEGPYFVTVPYSALKEVIDPAGPLGKLAGLSSGK